VRTFSLRSLGRVEEYSAQALGVVEDHVCAARVPFASHAHRLKMPKADVERMSPLDMPLAQSSSWASWR
jgi:hypothetical protein